MNCTHDCRHLADQWKLEFVYLAGPAVPWTTGEVAQSVVDVGKFIDVLHVNRRHRVACDHAKTKSTLVSNAKDL